MHCRHHRSSLLSKHRFDIIICDNKKIIEREEERSSLSLLSRIDYLLFSVRPENILLISTTLLNVCFCMPKTPEVSALLSVVTSLLFASK